MMGAVRNNVLEVRVNDLHRIIQLEGGSDLATDEMNTHSDYHFSSQGL